LKEHLAIQKFHEAEELKNKFTIWLGVQAVEFCDIIIQRPTPRFNKCLNKGVDYVEKYLRYVLRVFSFNFVNKYLKK
jgi:hypothetical protein